MLFLGYPLASHRPPLLGPRRTTLRPLVEGGQWPENPWFALLASSLKGKLPYEARSNANLASSVFLSLFVKFYVAIPVVPVLGHRLPQSSCRATGLVEPEPIGCWLVKRQAGGGLIGDLIVQRFSCNPFGEQDHNSKPVPVVMVGN